jgi:hypothetical protein
MTKTPILTLAFLTLTATGAYAQMTQPGSMVQMPGTQGMQTPYIQSPAPAAPSVQTSPTFSGSVTTAQPTVPAPIQPQIQGYTPPGTTGPLGTPGLVMSPAGTAAH